MLELRLLGRFVVLRAGREVPPSAFGGRKVRTLLRILATQRGSLVSHDALTDMLWPGQPPADPAANLGVLVHRARHALGDASLLVTGPGGYALADGDACRVDGEEFLASVAACQRLAGRQALAGYRSALATWGGEPLAEDLYADWATDYRRRLAQARQEALERAAGLAIEFGDPALAVELAATAAQSEPLRERAALTLVKALAAAGDTAAALEQYDAYRRALADQLGLDPSPDAAALQGSLLRGGVRTTRRARPGWFRALDDLVFVGRDRELATALAGLRRRPVGVVTIAGRSGVGKSRLLAEISGRLRTVSARAFVAERAEPWSLARTLLREVLADDSTMPTGLPPTVRSALSTVLPEVEGDSRAVLDPETRRALVIEAAVRLLGSLPEVAILVDDLQWADPSSVLLLGAVLDRVPEVAMALAYRPEELRPGAVFALLERLPGAVGLELSALPAAAIGQLAVTPELATTLANRTDRTPLAVLEVLRALAAEGAVSCDAQGGWRAQTRGAAGRAAELADAGQRRAIEVQADRHGALAGLVLALLSLLGREAAARTVAAAAGVGERQVLDALGQLSAAGLARLGNQGWATGHDMVGEVIAGRLAAADRGRLHGLLAPALVATAADTAEVARHWQGAGDGQQAAEAYLTAAYQALGGFADQEAADLAQAGLGLVAPVDLRARLLDARAQARSRLGDLEGARGDLREALTGHPGGPGRAGLLARLATLASGSDDLVRAAELAEQAIIEARDDPQARAQALEVAAVLDMNLDRPRRAAHRADAALALYRRSGDAQGRARILDGRAMATFLDGDITAGVLLFQQVANLFEDCGDLVRLVTPRSTRGHALVFNGQPVAGLVDATGALETARTLGHPEGQAYALWHRSEALSALDRADEASHDAREALAIANRLGHRGWTATGWRAVGIAEQARGDLEAALDAFTHSLACSEHLGLFASWAAARSASVLVALGRAALAAPLADRALAQGPPLGHYEARLAQIDVAAAMGDDRLAELAAEAQRVAVAGGYRLELRRLADLAARLGGPAPR